MTIRNLSRGWLLCMASLLLTACNALQHVPCGQLNEKLFTVNGEGRGKKLFFYSENDTLKTYPIRGGMEDTKGMKGTGSPKNDSLSDSPGDFTGKTVSVFPDRRSLQVENYPRIVWEAPPPDRLAFYRSGMNAAFIVLPIKFRPQVGEIPVQLNSDFNGAFFLGYSHDSYSLGYKPVTSHLFSRQLNHFQISFGGFIGIGSTQVLHTSTAHATIEEYDGVVLQKGMAANIGVNNFTMGVALGFDNLLGKDRKIWIYQNKPYLAFIIGFNIQ